MISTVGALPLFRRSRLRPRLRMGAEPYGTVGWTHASSPLLPFGLGGSMALIRHSGRYQRSPELAESGVGKRARLDRKRSCSRVLPASRDRARRIENVIGIARRDHPDTMMSGCRSAFVLFACPHAQKAGKAASVGASTRRREFLHNGGPDAARRGGEPGRRSAPTRRRPFSWPNTRPFPFAGRANTI